MNFTIRDCGGVTHSVSVSSDKRGLAFDSLPRSMSRRPRVARDQELPELPDQIDDDFACVAIAEILKRVGDPGDILAKVQRNVHRSDQNGNGDSGDYTSHTPAQPPYNRGSGFARPGGALDRRRAAQDAALAVDRRESVIRRFGIKVKAGF